MACKDIEHRRAYHRQYMAERREMYRKHHLCTECGKEDAYTMIGHTRCFDCTHRRRKQKPLEYIKPKKPVEMDMRKEPGYCHLCGKPVKEGLTKWGGRPFKVCEKHYGHIIQMGERGRAAYQQKYGKTRGQYLYDVHHNLAKLDSSRKKNELVDTERYLRRNGS